MYNLGGNQASQLKNLFKRVKTFGTMFYKEYRAEQRVKSRVWGRGGLMVNALDSGASAPGSSPGLGHCVVFLGKTLHSHSASLQPGV